MTQIVLFTDRQTDIQLTGQVGSEAKNPLLINSNNSWTDLAGLSWIFFENDEI